MSTERTLQGIYRAGSTHWVGDGFQVHNLFPSNELDRELSPYLLLDYAAPHEFPPSERPHGVGEHPHRGFETVTVVYRGELEHRDSGGNAGRIGPGDVQWMTAASGVVHEEMHARDFAKRGGVVEMVQLWVNLPRAHKMSAPHYQTLLAGEIPAVDLDGAASARVIAGELHGKRGPAQTVTPVMLFDVRAPAGAVISIPVTDGHNAGMFVLDGHVRFPDGAEARDAQLAVFAPRGDSIEASVLGDTRLLVLGGAPIDEPIARHGPFVMNTQAEIIQAVSDYRVGKMGHL
jgi:redox-sensitive bicupin YhaK (pirin superfamily)